MLWIRVALACYLACLAESVTQCMVPGVTSSCVVSPSGGATDTVTWSLDVNESATWWMLITFQQPRMVDRVEIKALSPQHPTPLSSVLLQFSDGTTSQMMLTDEVNAGTLQNAVLTQGVTISAGDSGSLLSSADTVLSYSIVLHEANTSTGLVVTAPPLCTYLRTPCPHLHDGNLLTSHVVMPDQTLVFAFAVNVSLSGIAFLEGNLAGNSSYRKFRLYPRNQPAIIFTLCELPGDRGVSWQHTIFLAPVTTDGITIIFDHPVYQKNKVWGLLETRFYTTTDSSTGVIASRLCDGESPPGRRIMTVRPATAGAQETQPQRACADTRYPYGIVICVLVIVVIALLAVVVHQKRRMQKTPPSGESPPPDGAPGYVNPVVSAPVESQYNQIQDAGTPGRNMFENGVYMYHDGAGVLRQA